MITANGMQMGVEDRGTGPVILFVHGFPLDHQMWRAQLDEFASDHRVIAPDLRGFGRSAITNGTVTMEQFADDLNALLDVLGVDHPVTFCGLSMGGYVAFQFERKYGERLKSLILCDTRSVADSPEAAEDRHKSAQNVLENGAGEMAKTMLPKLLAPETQEGRPDVVAQLQNTIMHTDREGIAAALHGMAERPDVTSRLSDIHVPTLVLVGEHDQISNVAEMQRIAEAIPGAEFVVIPDAGHMAPLENPQRVNAAIRSFLAQTAD